METYSVEAILSATDKGFVKGMKNADDALGDLNDKSQKTGVSIGDIAKNVGVFKLVDGAVNMVTSSLGGAINRFDTLNKYPTVMEALGYSTQEVDKSMNKLTDGIDGLPTRLDDIVANTQQLAISTGSLDKGTDTAIALNNAFLASGASTADAARGMEQYRQMLGRGEVDMQSFKSVQETMPIAMDKVAKSFKDRGVTSVNELYDALKSGDVTVAEFNDRLIELNDGVGGFADLAQKNSKGIQTSFENIKSAVVKGVEQTVRALDEGLQGAGLGSIADNLDKIKGVVNETFKVINSVIPPAIKAIVELLEMLKPYLPIMAALVGYFTVFSKVVAIQSKISEVTKAYKLWIAATEGATLAQKLLNVAMEANWIAIIISAIVALTGYIIYLWNTNEDFRNAIMTTWQSISDFLQPIINFISSFITNTFDQVYDWFVENQQKIQNLVQTVWGVIQGIFEVSMMAIKFVVSIVLAEIQTIWSIWSNVVSMIVKVAWNLISNVFSGSLADILSIVTFGIDQIKLVVDVVMNVVRGIIQTIWSLITGDWKAALDGINQVIDAFGKYVTGTFDNVMNLAKDLIENGINTIKRIFDSLADINLFEAGKAIIDGFIDGLKQTWEAGKEFVGGIADWIREHKGPISYDRTLLTGNGMAIMDSLNAGLDTGFSKVQDNINDMTKFFAKTDFVQDFEIGANFNDFNRKINSMNDMNLSSNNELMLKNSAQPAEIKLNIGGRVFSAFVEDIGAVMQAETDLNLQT